MSHDQIISITSSHIILKYQPFWFKIKKDVFCFLNIQLT